MLAPVESVVQLKALLLRQPDNAVGRPNYRLLRITPPPLPLSPHLFLSLSLLARSRPGLMSNLPRSKVPCCEVHPGAPTLGMERGMEEASYKSAWYTGRLVISAADKRDPPPPPPPSPHFGGSFWSGQSFQMGPVLVHTYNGPASRMQQMPSEAHFKQSR